MTPTEAINTAQSRGWCRVRMGLWVWRADYLREQAEVEGDSPFYVIHHVEFKPIGVSGAEDPRLIQLVNTPNQVIDARAITI